MNTNNSLYIFVHIPKTAGETFKHTIEASLPKDCFVRTSFNYFESYYNIKQNKYTFFEGKEAFTSYINSLTVKEKANIKCIGGHDSYYGIHTHFTQPPRYFAFFREPVARTISLYNYERMAWDIHSRKTGPLNIFEENFIKRMKDHFLINHQVPSFEEWLTEVYDNKIPFYYSMTNYLKVLGFLNHDSKNPSFSDALSKFYFIGITERYNEDALYLYKELGINKFAFDTNASTPYVSLDKLGKGVIEKIMEVNQQDISLYEAALKENEKCRMASKSIPIKKALVKKKLFLFRKSVFNKLKSVLKMVKQKLGITLKWRKSLAKSD